MQVFRRWPLTGFVVWSCLCTAKAQDQNGPDAAPASRAEIQRLINDLAAPERRIRHAAEQRLIEFGEPALSALAGLSEPADPAVQDAADRIAQTIENSLASKLLGGRQVELSDRTARPSLAAALGEIESQTGFAIQLPADRGERNKRLALDRQAGLFWTMFQTICNAADVGWEWGDNDVLRVSPELPRLFPAWTADGCCLVRAAVVPRRKSFADPNSRRLIRLNLRIDVEPGIKPYYVVVNDADQQLTAGGDSLSPFTPDARRELTMIGHSVEVPLDFVRDPNQRLTSGSLQGQATLHCAARRLPLDFALGAGGERSQRAGRTTVTLIQVKPAEQGYEALFRVSQPRDFEWESHRLGLLHRDVSIRTAAGEAVRTFEHELVKVESNLHTVSFYIMTSEPAENLTLTYRAPTLFQTRRIEFRVGEVPFGE